MNNVMTETMSIQMDARTVLLIMDTHVIQILQMFAKQLVEMIYEQIQKIVRMETIFQMMVVPLTVQLSTTLTAIWLRNPIYVMSVEMANEDLLKIVMILPLLF